MKLSGGPTRFGCQRELAERGGVSYFLEQSTDLTSPFKLLAPNILGQVGTTSYVVTNATGAGPCFYRVGVNPP